MQEQNGLDNWLIKIREFSSGVIALITSAAALVIAIRGEPSLYKVFIAIAILVFVSLACLYIAFSKTKPSILGGKGIYRFERYRISALMGIGAIAGIVVAFTSIQSNRTFVLNALSGSTTTTTDLCDYYGFEISEPLGGYVFENGQARISGAVKELPPYGSIRLMTIVDGNPVSYWPQSWVAIDPTTKKWNGVIYAPCDVTAAVVVLGSDAQALFDYFGKVVDTATSQDAQYPGLTQLTKDVQTCKTVIVRQP